MHTKTLQHNCIIISINCVMGVENYHLYKWTLQNNALFIVINCFTGVKYTRDLKTTLSEAVHT